MPTFFHVIVQVLYNFGSIYTGKYDIMITSITSSTHRIMHPFSPRKITCENKLNIIYLSRLEISPIMFESHKKAVKHKIDLKSRLDFLSKMAVLELLRLIE